MEQAQIISKGLTITYEHIGPFFSVKEINSDEPLTQVQLVSILSATLQLIQNGSYQVTKPVEDIRSRPDLN